MKVWTVKFTGHYPVGACAVVVAPTLAQAIEILTADLAYRGLKQDHILDFVPLDLTVTQSTVILDGEY